MITWHEMIIGYDSILFCILQMRLGSFMLHFDNFPK